MPNSPHSAVSAEAVRSYLVGVLPSSRLTFEPVDSGHEPLVLLQTDHVAAGFGFSNGDLQKSYELAYQKFKTHFAAQNGLWDSLDLAFVFCVEPSFSKIDQFCSNVETDVYFCRKFVVPLSRSLGSSLARLPFLPLTPLEGNALRPASAQTFLQHSGVSSVLARYIVVQGERGPERIIKDCVSGEFGAPVNPSVSNNAASTQTDSGADCVRLEEITIKNFRAYRKPQTFPMGAGVTVLYGPNGFGKTSFFDAVDFAVTGGIGRVETSNDAHFSKMARHLDAAAEDSLVTLSFRSKGVTRKIARTVKARKDALMDGRPTDRKSVLSELTGRDIPVTDRVENFVNLFRATHLFNQELQELTKDFQDDCCLSSEIVSRMLAFQDYANALSKTEKVLEALSEIIKSSDTEILELSGQIADDTKELNRLNQSSGASTSTVSLGAQFEELKSKLEAAGIAPGTAQAEVATARRWRASIGAKQGECQNRSAKLSGLTEALASLPRIRTELATAETQVRQKEQALAIADEKRTSSEAALQILDQALAELSSKLTIAQVRAALFEWHRVTKPVYLDLSQKQRTLNEEIIQIRSDVEKLRLAEQEIAGELRIFENRSIQANDKLKLRRRELDALRALVDLLPLWQRSLKSLANIAESEAALQKSIESLQVEDKKLAEQVTALSEEEQRLSRQVDGIDQTQSAFRALLLQLQGHVKSGTCPLCGEDHRTQKDLLDRIQRQLKDDPASKTRAELIDIRKRAAHMREALGTNRTKQESARSDFLNSQRLRSTCETDINAFNTAALQSGIVLEASAETTEEILQAKISPIQKEVDQLEAEIKTLSDALEPKRTNSAHAKNLLAARLADEAAKTEASVLLARDAEAMRIDPRWAQLPLDTDQEKITRDEKTVLEQTASLRSDIGRAQPEADKKRSAVALFRKESTTLRNQLQPLRSQIANLHRKLTEITAKMEEANLPTNATEESVLALIGEETRQQEVLAGLQHSAANLEQALDAVTTAAVLGTLQQTVRNKEKAVEHAKQKRDRHKPWLNYFNSISKLLSDQQNQAISNFTNEYGPRTSVIQRRLRSVYGFDDIEIQSQESKIRVRVKRHGEELRPTDYFSQSQQQTLLLGLFLTACISQTWSGFSPIFMDDPVTHFDDLNTYAFLDLIVGLLESDSGKRQFVISTCDEKLLQLARQKFRHLGDSAVFYRFEAIGEDGPIVDKILNKI